MSSTPSLPEEVVARIFEHLEISASSHGWTRDEETMLEQGSEDADTSEAHAEGCQDERLINLRTLANASLVSRAFHRIVSPTLHHTVELSSTGKSDNIAYQKLSRFARTLQDRPEAAMSVRALCFRGFTMSVVNPNKDWGTRARGWARWAERLAGRLLQRLSTLECTRVDMALRLFCGSPGALTLVILCMCRRLKTLEMKMVEGRLHDNVLTAAIRLIFTGTPRTDVMLPLQGFEGLRLRHGVDVKDEEREKPHISSLISLPALGKLSASTTEWSLEPSGFLAPPEFVLQELHLSGQGVDQATLEVLLVKCPNLKTLSISWDTAGEMERDINDGIVDVLRASGRSLEKLSLRQIGQGVDNAGQPMQRLGSLHQLRDLHELSLPLDLMLGSGGALLLSPAVLLQGLLPISIEVLEIYDCRSPALEVRHWLVDLAENVEYPRLHTIRLEASRTTRPVGMVNAWWKRRDFEDWVEFSRNR